MAADDLRRRVLRDRLEAAVTELLDLGDNPEDILDVVDEAITAWREEHLL